MAITPRAVGAWAYAASGSVTTTLPTHATGDMLLVRVAYKSSTITTCAASTATSAAGRRSGEHRRRHGQLAATAPGPMAIAGVLESKPHRRPRRIRRSPSARPSPRSVTSPCRTRRAAARRGQPRLWCGSPGTPVRRRQTSVNVTAASASLSRPSDRATSSTASSASADDTDVHRARAVTRRPITWSSTTVEYPATAGISTAGADGAYDGGYRIAT